MRNSNERVADTLLPVIAHAFRLTLGREVARFLLDEAMGPLAESFGQSLAPEFSKYLDVGRLESASERKRIKRLMNSHLTREFKEKPDPEVQAFVEHFKVSCEQAKGAVDQGKHRTLGEISAAYDERWAELASHSAEVRRQVSPWFGPWEGAQERKRRLYQELGAAGAGQEVIATFYQAARAAPDVIDNTALKALISLGGIRAGFIPGLADES